MIVKPFQWFAKQCKNKIAWVCKRVLYFFHNIKFFKNHNCKNSISVCLCFYYTSLSSTKHSEVSWGEKSSSAFERSQKETFLIITGIISDPMLVTNATIDDLPHETAFMSYKTLFSFRRHVALLLLTFLAFYVSFH